jgi:exodeoxyribonuclease-3
MKIVSFNVNGIRAISKKTKENQRECCFDDNVICTLTNELNPDILCLQEVRTSNQKDVEKYLSLYPHCYFNCAEKKGYSGTSIISKIPALTFFKNFDACSEIEQVYSEHKWLKEGRVCTLEFEDFYLINVYVPNAGSGLERRICWDNVFRYYCGVMSEKKPIIVCGDLNCAHEPIDVGHPEYHSNSPGYTIEERNGFSSLLNKVKLNDVFRTFHPNEKGHYTYWSNFCKKRKKDNGWRIDYFLVSESLFDRVLEIKIELNYYGSDHCPLYLSIK